MHFQFFPEGGISTSELQTLIKILDAGPSTLGTLSNIYSHRLNNLYYIMGRDFWIKSLYLALSFPLCLNLASGKPHSLFMRGADPGEVKHEYLLSPFEEMLLDGSTCTVFCVWFCSFSL